MCVCVRKICLLYTDWLFTGHVIPQRRGRGLIYSNYLTCIQKFIAISTMTVHWFFSENEAKLSFEILVSSTNLAFLTILYWHRGVLRIFFSTHVWVAECNRYLPCNSWMVGVVSSIPTGGNFFFAETFWVPWCNLHRNLRFVLKTKASIEFVKHY